MKKIIAIVLLLTLVLAGCGKDTGYDDHFTHTIPEEMEGYEQVLLEREDYAEHIESILNVLAYPDLLTFDETGYNVTGMYTYDPETGMATGWTDLTTGDKVVYGEGQQKDLGKPDPSKMVEFKGTVKLGFAVYKKDDMPVGLEMYFFLTDAADAALLQDYMLDYRSEVLTQESELVYKVIKDEKGVEEDFQAEIASGANFYNKNMEEYLSILKLNYGVTPVE